MAKFGVRESFTCPTPRPRYGDGPKIWLNKDNTMTCSYDVPKQRVIMAQDQAPNDHMGDLAIELSELLQGLSPTDRSRAEALIIKLIERDSGANTDDPVPSATDEPQEFVGKPPRPGMDPSTMPRIIPGMPGTARQGQPAVPNAVDRLRLRAMAGDKAGDANDYGFRADFLKRLPGSRIPRRL
jgi:hypothetical protein